MQREAQNNLKQVVPYQDQNKHNEILALINSPETDFSLKKYTTTSVIEKNIAAWITGVAFGLVVGFIPIIQSDYINNLRFIELSDIIILFGMGIGIGNLNETISKIWENSKESEEN